MGEPGVSSTLFGGRFEIGRELGHGGTAVVHLARDITTQDVVALKVLRDVLVGSAAGDRFLRELGHHQRLKHPNILPVLESGTHEGQLYLVLPYMEGGTLRDRLAREKQLPLPEALAIARSIGAALTHAHAQGLVHRDVKPENILFTGGQACLGDFGIARALERAIDDPTTSTSIVRGTPIYMSPEQAAGDRSLDSRSDVYSFGCVVYEMLAGMHPFAGPTLESIVGQRLLYPPRPARAYRPSIPASVERVLARALTVSRADRYQTAAEFVEALESAIEHPEEAVPASPTRSRLLYASIPIAATAAVIAAVIWQARAEPPNAGEVPAGDPRRIAVLYFDDHSPGGTINHIAAGLTENLIDQLSQVPALRVTAPNGVRPFRNDSVPLDTVASRLGVGTIIAGSVASSGTQLRVTVRLIDARTGGQLQSRTLQHALETLFQLQDTLTTDVALWLREHLGREVRLRAQAATTASVPAWEWVQRGEAQSQEASALVLRHDPRAVALFARADSAFGIAEALDPRWPVATIGRAQNAFSRAFAYAERGRVTPEFASQLWESVRLADLALSRDERLAEARALRGEALMRLVQLTGAAPAESLLDVAVADLQRAVAERPDASRAWFALGATLDRLGRFEEAASAFRTAYDQDAFLTNARAVLGQLVNAKLLSGDFEEARRWCRTGKNRYPTDPRIAECELNVLGWSGRSGADAVTAWRTLAQIERDDSTGVTELSWAFRRMMVAAILARASLEDSARAVVARTNETRGDRVRAFYPEAYVAVLLGDRDHAIDILTQMLATMPTERQVVARHPWFAKLRTDPRFNGIVAPR